MVCQHRNCNAEPPDAQPNARAHTSSARSTFTALAKFLASEATLGITSNTPGPFILG